MKVVNYLHKQSKNNSHGFALGKCSHKRKTASISVEAKLADFDLAKICEFAQKSQTILAEMNSSRSDFKSSDNLCSKSFSTRNDFNKIIQY